MASCRRFLPIIIDTIAHSTNILLTCYIPPHFQSTPRGKMANTYYCCHCDSDEEFFYGKCKSCNHEQCNKCRQDVQPADVP